MPGPATTWQAEILQLHCTSLHCIYPNCTVLHGCIIKSVEEPDQSRGVYPEQPLTPSSHCTYKETQGWNPGSFLLMELLAWGHRAGTRDLAPAGVSGRCFCGAAIAGNQHCHLDNRHLLVNLEKEPNCLKLYLTLSPNLKKSALSPNLIDSFSIFSSVRKRAESLWMSRKRQ